MNTQPFQGLFNFSIKRASFYSSFKIVIEHGHYLRADICGRFLKSKRIEIMHDASENIIFTIEANNLWESKAALMQIHDGYKVSIANIEIRLKGLIGFYFGKALETRLIRNNITISFYADSIIQQIRSFLFFKSNFPVFIDDDMIGNFKMMEKGFGGCFCSFIKSEEHGISDDSESGIAVLAGALWLLKVLTSSSG